MKFLKNFESVEFDDDTIRDLFLPIIDLGCVDFKFFVNGFGPYEYDISWNYKIDLDLSNIDDLPEHKQGTKRLNEIIEETYSIIDTLTDMNFKLDYYGMDFNMGIQFKQVTFNLTIISN